MSEIRINTEEVSFSATSIEELNKKLNEKLLEGQTTVKSLASTFEGQAAQATFDTFDAFATKYFDEYKALIDNYVSFLRNKVSEGYFETETANISIGENLQ